MKIKAIPMPDVISLEKIIRIGESDDDDETLANGELEPGTYAMDSTGRVWREIETVSGLIQELTESDGIKRRRAKRT